MATSCAMLARHRARTPSQGTTGGPQCEARCLEPRTALVDGHTPSTDASNPTMEPVTTTEIVVTAPCGSHPHRLPLGRRK